MSDAVAHLSPDRALRMVAASPGGKAKSATTLRREARDLEVEAHAADWLLSREPKAATDRANAKLVTLAAAELERRKVSTVGDALRNPVVRFLRRLGRRG